MDISGLDKAEVLAVLYNAARPQGMGFLHYDPTPMSVEEARALLAQTTDFDYLKGRVMKIQLDGDELESTRYNRDNGEGAAEVAIESLRSTGQVDNDATARIHEYGTTNAAHHLAEQMEEQRRRRQEG